MTPPSLSACSSWGHRCHPRQGLLLLKWAIAKALRFKSLPVTPQATGHKSASRDGGRRGAQGKEGAETWNQWAVWGRAAWGGVPVQGVVSVTLGAEGGGPEGELHTPTSEGQGGGGTCSLAGERLTRVGPTAFTSPHLLGHSL